MSDLCRPVATGVALAAVPRPSWGWTQGRGLNGAEFRRTCLETRRVKRDLGFGCRVSGHGPHPGEQSPQDATGAHSARGPVPQTRGLRGPQAVPRPAAEPRGRRRRPRHGGTNGSARPAVSRAPDERQKLEKSESTNQFKRSHVRRRASARKRKIPRGGNDARNV